MKSLKRKQRIKIAILLVVVGIAIVGIIGGKSWSTISLITVGYGDIYAVSEIGKLITMISSILGVAIIARPVSIMTAGYLEEIEKEDTESK